MITPTNFDVMAVPDFVAGFVFGMTADNHLSEIEACMTDGELMVDEIESGIASFKKGGKKADIHAIIELGLAVVQIPKALKTCKSMGDNISAIESWAAIFEEPKVLAKTVGKHYLFHGMQMKSDIISIKSDWESANFFKSGVDLAALMNVAVGPIESNGLEMPPINKVVPDFTAGLLKGFTGNDHRAELEGCMTDLEPLAEDAMTAFDDIKSFHLMKFAGDLGNFIWMLPDAVSSCGQLT